MVRVGGPLRVLLVGSDDDSTCSLQALIGSWGYTVDTAPDGPAALGLVPTFLPDVVLVELNLPRMDGFEVARRLRQIPPTDLGMLIALSGNPAADTPSCQQAGFDEIFTKPPAEERLRTLLAVQSALLSLP
jgi:two-component system CheB/CheR fusion protein